MSLSFLDCRWSVRSFAVFVFCFVTVACQDNSVTLPHQTLPDLRQPPNTRDDGPLPTPDVRLPPTPDVPVAQDQTKPPDPGVLPDTPVADWQDPIPEPPGPCDDPLNCPCVGHSDCVQYDAYDLCKAKHQCVNGFCTRPAGPNVECPSVHPAPCMQYKCHPDWGLCVDAPSPPGTACDDGDLCTTNDQCANLSCVAGTSVNCDDGNDCTDDSCDISTGACVYQAVGCSDNDPCTNDGCADGACFHTVVDCDDQNACTADSCSLLTGQCSNISKSCDDNDECTIDSCDAQSGDCHHDPDPACQVTFAEINAQILVHKCVPCHLPNTFGCAVTPKFVGDYDVTQNNPPSISECSSVPGYKLGGCFKVVVQDHVMPPSWDPVGSCWLGSAYNEFSYSATYNLTPQEKAMIIDWVDGGMLP